MSDGLASGKPEQARHGEIYAPETARPSDPLASSLAVASTGAFLQAMGRIPADTDLRGRRGAELISDVVRALSDRGELPERAQAERVQAILVRLRLQEPGLLVLAQRAATWSPGLRNTVAAFLTPEQRRVLTAPRGTAARDTPEDRERGAASSNSLARPLESIPTLTDLGEASSGVHGPGAEEGEVGSHDAFGASTSEVAEQAAAVTRGVTETEATPDVATRRSALSLDGPGLLVDRAPLATTGGRGSPKAYAVVAILSKRAQQDENKQVLQEPPHAFAPYVWDSVEKLAGDLTQNRDVCACLVDGSILQELDAQQQRSLFAMLSGYSTFLWIRVHDHGLQLSRDDVRAVVRQARGGIGPVAGLTFDTSSVLSKGEVEDIAGTHRTLCAMEEAELRSTELSDDESRLLMAAARRYAEEHHYGSTVVVESLEAKFLEGGKSGARTARVQISGTRTPLLAKIHTKHEILTEIRRFRTFVQGCDDRLRPEAHFHGDVGVLLFAFVSREDSVSRPADGVDQCLESLWNSELGVQAGGDSLEHRKLSLMRGLANVASALVALNGQTPPNAPELSTFANPVVSHFERIEAGGWTWGLPTDAFAARDRAAARMARMATSAVVHGDLHLRNALLRGDREAFLIDYAASGAGHPAVDLARFEVGLLVTAMRLGSGEESFVALQRRLTAGEDSALQLIAAFPELHNCALNEVCTHGCVSARDAALRVVGQHGGERLDYVAVKLLVAWQALGFFGLNAGLARAVILALSPLV